jgi:hypothetical protein
VQVGRFAQQRQPAFVHKFADYNFHGVVFLF